MNKKIKFGIFSDLHVDIMHDTQGRLREFLRAARENDVDFIIQLGDFCYPDEGRRCVCKSENQPVNIANSLIYPTYADKNAIISLYKNFEKPAYHVIGNHDCDMCSKEMILDYYGADYGSYYSFDMGDIHFIVLDTNYYMEDGEYYSYDFGNYFDSTPGKKRTLPYIPPVELEWLRRDLDSTDKPSVIFTHQSLRSGAPRAILNASDFQKVIKNRRSRVVACFNGHIHIDGATKDDGVWYVHVNSMSNHWMGEDYTSTMRYTAEIDEKYPNIRYVAPYSNALYAIAQIDRDGLEIKGRRGEFVGKSPDELDYYERKRGRELLELGEERVSAEIKDRYLPFI